MHFIEAASLLNDEEKPNESHLLGSAVIEKDVQHKIDKISQKIFHYYSENDSILNYFFKVYSLGENAIG
jgi:hypothetical protein